MNGFLLTQWFKFLDTTFGQCMKSKRTIFLKIVSDQIVFGPFSIISFFAFTSCIASDNQEQMMGK